MIQAKNVTVQDIVEECKSFFFAGKQTTSNLLTWTTILLSMHPEWQAKARDEVLRVCGSRDVPTKDHVVKLKTVRFLFLASALYSFVFGNVSQNKIPPLMFEQPIQIFNGGLLFLSPHV